MTIGDPFLDSGVEALEHEEDGAEESEKEEEGGTLEGGVFERLARSTRR